MVNRFVMSITPLGGSMNIHLRGCNFVDDLGRTMIQRGINLSGSSKVPFSPNGATQIDESLFEHDMFSILGRPLPLNQANEPIEREHVWGFYYNSAADRLFAMMRLALFSMAYNRTLIYYCAIVGIV